MSYCCKNNLDKISKKFNLSNYKTGESRNDTNINQCNCRGRNRCPLNGACNSMGTIYRAKLEALNGNNKIYVGGTEC